MFGFGQEDLVGGVLVAAQVACGDRPPRRSGLGVGFDSPSTCAPLPFIYLWTGRGSFLFRTAHPFAVDATVNSGQHHELAFSDSSVPVSTPNPTHDAGPAGARSPKFLQSEDTTKARPSSLSLIHR